MSGCLQRPSPLHTELIQFTKILLLFPFVFCFFLQIGYMYICITSSFCYHDVQLLSASSLTYILHHIVYVCVTTCCRRCCKSLYEMSRVEIVLPENDYKTTYSSNAESTRVCTIARLSCLRVCSYTVFSVTSQLGQVAWPFSSCFYSKTGFWPSYCQISTNLDKILHTLIVVWSSLVHRLRPRSARGRLQVKPERLCFCNTCNAPYSYIETTDRRDFCGKP